MGRTLKPITRDTIRKNVLGLAVGVRMIHSTLIKSLQVPIPVCGKMNDGYLFDNGSFQCEISHSHSLHPVGSIFHVFPPPPPKLPIHPEGSLSNADPTPRRHSKGARICSDLPNSPQELDYPQHTCTPIQVITQQLSVLPSPSMNRATPPLLVQVHSRTTMGREPQRSRIRTKDKGGNRVPHSGTTARCSQGSWVN